MRAPAENRPSRLLIIDDDPLIRLVAQSRLSAAGFEIVEAAGGEEGVEAFESLRPDLILLDVVMPGLSGFEVCEAIRRSAAGKHVPILIMTGRDDIDSIERAYQAGATDFVSKPLNWVVLQHRIFYILRASHSFLAVRSQQVRLDEMQHYARLGSWEIDLATQSLSASSALRSMVDFGDDSEYFETEKLLHLVPPEDRESLSKLIAEAIEKGTGFGLDHRIVGIGGAERIVHSQGRVRTGGDAASVVVEGFSQDITERRRAEEQIQLLAYSDSLTGLANRAGFKRYLANAVRRARRVSGSVAVLFLDLDQFKRVNDTFGHTAGDSLLTYVADQLSDTIRNTDWVVRNASVDPDVMISRLGGDEFTILLEDLDDPADAAVVARRVLSTLSQPVMVEGHEILITASIGIAVSPHDGEDVDSLLRNADSAMYHAKELGRANFQFYREVLNQHALEQLECEVQLRRAIESDDLVVHYQPKLDLATGRITGCEALARLRGSDHEFVSPAEFIPLAESSGLISSLGESVLRQACSAARRWQDGGHPDFRLAVNLSPGQLKDEQVIERIESVLEETGFDPRLLEFEITESALIHNEGPAGIVLEAFRQRGIRISLDDFGTGFSSLSYLKRFPVQTLKIDQSFIAGIGSSNEDKAITAAILSMARDLDLRVVAEGIETEEQLLFLERRRCDEVQGFLISRPLSAEDFQTFLDEYNAGKG